MDYNSIIFPSSWFSSPSLEEYSTNSLRFDISMPPNYWANGSFENLTCLYNESGPSHFDSIWENTLHGYETELLSHVCLNGSFAHLSREEWNKRCFPTINEDVTIRRITGVWSLFNFIAGTVGNLLTLIAIPYAARKRRYNFQSTFWKTDVWILHLAFCDLVFCIFCAPHYFIPYLGSRYPQMIGSDYACTLSFIITILTFTNDWLLVAIVALTRVFMVKCPDGWGNFCSNKIYVFSAFISTWIFQILVMLPIFIQPSIDIGYNCLMGKCNYVPTGKEQIKALSFAGNPVFVGLPYLVAFLAPCFITMISYFIIWRAMKKNKRNIKGIMMPNEKEKAKEKLKDADIKFIWTVFIICLCYLLCALPGIVLVDVFGLRDGTTFMVSLCLLWIQFSLNNFIYAYRSEKYRSAYWDLIVLIFPFLKKSSSSVIQSSSCQRIDLKASSNNN